MLNDSEAHSLKMETVETQTVDESKGEALSKELDSDRINLSNDVTNNSFLKTLKIQKHTVSKLTLSIRRQQEKFLYDEMEGMSIEDKLNFLDEHLTSLQEKTYELRERQMASSKVKDLVLQEIDKLNVIDMSKYRIKGEIEPSKSQKKEQTRFEKDAERFLKMNMKPEAVFNILKKLGCPEEKAKLILNIE